MTTTAGRTAPDDRPRGALDGIRVLDMSRIMAGPWCAQILADLGADVIKIERPRGGDDTRSWGPPYVDESPDMASRQSAYFWSCNRGKRSIAVDLSKPAGRDVVARLAGHADVLIENYKTGTLARRGLGYEAMSQANPRLVYCSITGFGQTGPYSARPGYDTVVQAMGGLMSVTGRPDAAPGGGPLKVGVAVTDLMTGLYASVAILAALNERGTSGRGQHIDMALLDVQVAGLANIGMNYLASGVTPGRIGNRLPTVYPSDGFRCKDGDLMLIVGNDEQFERFCSVIGEPALARDPRFVVNEERVRNADALASLIAVPMAQRSVADWCAALESAQLSFSPINTLAQVFQDPQVLARNMVVGLQGAGGHEIPAIASPIRMSRTPPRYARPPPLLGQHSAEVLADVLGMGPDECDELSRQGAIS